MLPEAFGGLSSADRRGSKTDSNKATAGCTAAAAAAAAAADVNNNAKSTVTFERILDDDKPCPVINIPVFNKFNDIISENPVAGAETFKLILKCFWETVLGIHMESETRVSKPYQTNVRGFYGRVKLAFGVLEWGDNSKNLHAHGLATTNISPEICRLCAEFPFLANRIVSIMEASIRTDLPVGRLINEVGLKVRNEYFGPNPRPSCTAPPDPITNQKEYLNKVETAILYLQMHKHMKTCYTRKTGETGCRSGIHYGFVEESGVVRLIRLSDDSVFAYEHFDKETQSIVDSMSTIPGLATSLLNNVSKKPRVPFPTTDIRPIG